MQLYALDKEQLVFAPLAQRHRLYQCPECSHPVRVRGGPHRQIHFYHCCRQIHCSQKKKTLVHVHIQLKLHSFLEGSVMERPFKEINRIADVSWEKRGVVFEIQYSPISRTEAEERCKDYKKLGLTVVWILHDAQFNKRRLSDSEVFLRQQVHYYTNIDQKGQGMIYDQFHIFKNELNLFWGPRFPVDLSSFSPIQTLELKQELPSLLKQRLLNHSIYFKDDLIDRCSKPPAPSQLEHLIQLERKFLNSPSRASLLLQHIKKIYKSMLYTMLELLDSAK